MGRMPPTTRRTGGGGTRGTPKKDKEDDDKDKGTTGGRRTTRASPAAGAEAAAAGKKVAQPPPRPSATRRRRGSSTDTIPTPGPPPTRRGGTRKKKGDEEEEERVEVESPKKKSPAKTVVEKEKEKSPEKQKESPKNPKQEVLTPKKAVTNTRQAAVLESSSSDEEEEETDKRRQPLQKAAPRPRPQLQPQGRKVDSGSSSSSSSSSSSGSSSEEEEEEEEEEAEEEQEDVEITHQPSTSTASRSRKKKEKPAEELIKKGQEMFASMMLEDVQRILDNVDRLCSFADHATVHKREKLLDWNKVAFEPYEPEQCRALWSFLKAHTRNYRIMSEVVNEIKYRFTWDKIYQTKVIESLPGFPQKPPTAANGFLYYNRELWEKQKVKDAKESEHTNFIKFQRECRQKYDALPQKTKDVYEQKSANILEEYKASVRKFYEENPAVREHAKRMVEIKTEKTKEKKEKKERKPRKKKEKTETSSERRIRIKTEKQERFVDAPQPPSTPVVKFVQSRLSRMDPQPLELDLPSVKTDLVEKWKSLSSKKRTRWIDGCLDDCVAYLLQMEEYKKIHPDYTTTFKVDKILSKEDLAVWEKAKGKPDNPKATVFDLYFEDVADTPEYQHLPEDEKRAAVVRNFNSLEWYSTKMYKLKFQMQKVEYKQQLQEFFKKVPLFMRDTMLKRIQKPFWSELEKIDKVPIHSNDGDNGDDGNAMLRESLITAEAGVVYEKPHKSKKRRQQDQDTHNYDTEQVEMESEEVETYDGTSEPKKKKKKKKRDRDDQIHTSDPNDGGFQTTSTEDSRQLPQNYIEKFNAADSRPVYTLSADFVSKHKSSSKHFPHNNSITKSDVYETVRGIFDSRAVGHKFSAYYYYARYVAAEPYWIDKFHAYDLQKTAVEMIQGFLALTEMDQKRFIERSRLFHDSKRLNSKTSREPDPPPKLPQTLYNRDAKKEAKMRNEKITSMPSWTDLPQETHLHYVRKHYYLTRMYMKNYEEYIMNLTPSEFVEYAIYRYRMWEASLYSKDALAPAVKEFNYPLVAPNREEDIERDTEDLDGFEKKTWRPVETNNPFIDD